MNVLHDAVELVVHFFTRPGEAHAVLCHFQTGGGNAACVGSLGRTVQDLGGEVGVDTFQVGRHVGTFSDELATVLDERAGFFAVDLVLRGRREGAIAGNAPGALTFEVLSLRELFYVFGDTTATVVLQVHDPGKFFRVDAIGIVDEAAGIGQGYGLGSKLVELFNRVLGDIAGTGYKANLALKIVVAGSKHVLCEVHAAVARGFRTDQGTAPVQALAGQHACELVAETLVLAEHIADFAATDADVTSGNVCVGADVASEFGHEALAETHYFIGALALRIEVGAAFAAAHGQSGEGVLENLFEAKELQNAKVHARVETEAALVWPDCAVELDAVTAVHLHIALVINPRHTENDGAFRLNDTFQNGVGFIFRRRSKDGVDRIEDFLYCLKEFRFMRVLRTDVFQNALRIGLGHGCD